MAPKGGCGRTYHFKLICIKAHTQNNQVRALRMFGNLENKATRSDKFLSTLTR